jgi:hypothetical protein
LWNNTTEEEDKTTNHPKAKVVTVVEPVSVTVVEPASATTSETQAVQDPTGDGEEGETTVEGTTPTLSTEHAECLDGLKEKVTQGYDAIQDFLAMPDARLTHEQKKSAAIDKAQTLYDELHHVLGHRSREHTVRQIEWMYGKRMPPVVENMLEHCQGCDLSKLTSVPYMKEALVQPKRVGEILSADTIVDLPSSLSGYRYVIHITDVFSDYGAVWMTKTKAATKYGIYWIKHTNNQTSLGVAVFMADLGEFFSSDMVAYCEKKGVAFRVGVADTTNNMPIERRHRTLKEAMRSLMNTGGAGGHMWEFAVPHANHILNMTIKIIKLRDAGRPGKGRQRPLTPFEQFTNHGQRVDIQNMWRSLHHLFSLGVGYLEKPETHGNRAVLIIYLGHVCRNGAVDQHAHWGLVIDTKVITKFRTIKTYGEYPWIQKVRKSLNMESSFAKQHTASTSTSAVSETPAMEVTPEIKTSGGDSSGKDDRDPSENEAKHDFTHKSIVFEPEHKLPHRSKYYDKPFALGSIVMTMNGPTRILGVYPDGDYQCEDYGLTEPGEVYSLRPEDVWLEDDYPDWVYDHNGKNVSKTREERVSNRLPKKVTFDIQDVKEEDEETVPQPTPVRRHEHNLRQKSKRALGTQKETPFEDHLIDSNITFLSTSGSLKSLPRNRQTKALIVRKRFLPEGLPTTFTHEYLRTLTAAEVENLLPKHQHETFGHPMREIVEECECIELQACLNRRVWVDPKDIEEGDIVIGLMWVYAVKSKEGMYETIKGRITLMGNQERLQALIGRADAYAPVAQMITTRLMIALHLGTPFVFFRKIDIKNAYINEMMRRDVRCRLPPGYTIETYNGQMIFRRLNKGEKQPRISLKVNKALYGGMECGRIFWEAWVDWHLKDGFQIIHAERCYLHKRSDDGSFIKLGYHVDDNLVVGVGQEFYQAYLVRLKSKFDYKEEPLHEHLGVTYHFDMERGICHMNQADHTMKFLKLFGHEGCKPSPFPTLDGPEPCAADCEIKYKGSWDMESFNGNAI